MKRKITGVAIIPINKMDFVLVQIAKAGFPGLVTYYLANVAIHNFVTLDDEKLSK